MGLSLKLEEMIDYLEDAKAPGETFSCMLWGTVYADISNFQDHSAASIAVASTLQAGVAGSLNNAFCYIGLTDKSIYVIGLDAYNTSRITASFALPLANITLLNIRKAPLGASHTIEIESGEYVSLTVKGTSIGTNIKDQKDRMNAFLASMETLKNSMG